MNLAFNSLFRETKNSIIFSLGRLLSGGRSLINSLENVAVSSRDLHWRNGLLKAADLLKQGQNPEQVFRNAELYMLPPAVRYILGSPVPERQKGQLITGWVNGQLSFTFNFFTLFYPFQTFAVGTMTAMSLAMFVLPQFREIIMGLRVKLSPFLSMMLGTEGYLFSPMMGILALLIAAIALVFYLVLGRSLNLRVISDYACLLSMLEATDAEFRPEAFKIFGSRILFPSQFTQIKSFAAALSAGKSPAEAGEVSGIPAYINWFISLGLEGKNSTEMLSQGVMLLRESWVDRFEVFMTFLEAFVTVALGSFFGLSIYLVFAVMSSILQGAWQ